MAQQIDGGEAKISGGLAVREAEEAGEEAISMELGDPTQGRRLNGCSRRRRRRWTCWRRLWWPPTKQETAKLSVVLSDPCLLRKKEKQGKGKRLRRREGKRETLGHGALDL